MAKTAIITGGSRGIGEAMALKLGELGYNVVINYRSESSKALSDNLAANISSYNVCLNAILLADLTTYRMAKRGLKMCGVHFHSFPYTSPMAKQKAILSAILIIIRRIIVIIYSSGQCS